MLIFLIGFMGSGKTTLGKPLAARLGYRFIDLDKAIEEGEGSTVGEIFAVRGEAHFRTLEHKYLQNIVSHGGDLVVSTGGGTPCFGGNMELMNASGVTVYFKLSPAMLATGCRPRKSAARSWRANRRKNFCDILSIRWPSAKHITVAPMWWLPTRRGMSPNWLRFSGLIFPVLRLLRWLE